MRAVVTEGAGFADSHLSERLIQRGDAVVCVDNLATGRTDNIAHLLPEPQFDFLPSDVSIEIPVNVR